MLRHPCDLNVFNVERHLDGGLSAADKFMAAPDLTANHAFQVDVRENNLLLAKVAGYHHVE